MNVPSESPAAQVAHGAALAQAGRHGEAADIFRSVLARGGAPDLDALLGLAASLAALGEFASAREAFSIALELRPGSRDVQLRLYEIEQILGNCEAALDHLQAALDQNPLISTPARRRPARTTLLALSRAGMFEANTPYEFVVDPETVTLHRWYLRDDEHDVPDLTHLPEFDLLVNAIAESDAAKPALRAASRVFATYTGPKLNAPDAVATMDREGVAALFRDSALVNAPPIARRSRAALLAAPPAFPFLIRPIGSQAGVDLAKIDDAAQIAAYLAERPDRDEFYVTDFVDYRGADGFFRKYRVIFVAGEPFAYHAALSPNWMIHYYNAPMAENAWMREEEARFIDDISTVFAGPLMDGLREIAARFGVEYFGIDCSIAPDGRVLLFEADSAMLVHGTDDPVMYGYKIRGFERVRDALAALIDRKLGRA